MLWVALIRRPYLRFGKGGVAVIPRIEKDIVSCKFHSPPRPLGNKESCLTRFSPLCTGYRHIEPEDLSPNFVWAVRYGTHRQFYNTKFLSLCSGSTCTRTRACACRLNRDWSDTSRAQGLCQQVAQTARGLLPSHTSTC